MVGGLCIPDHDTGSRSDHCDLCYVTKESLTASSQIELGQVSDEGQSESESHVKPKHNTPDSRVAGAPATLLKPDTMRARMRY